MGSSRSRRPLARCHTRFILPWTPIHLQSMTETARRPLRGSSLLEVSRLTAPSLRGSARRRGCHPPPPSALGFSQPLDGLLPTKLRGLVSSRRHAQASPFRAFSSRGAVPPLGGPCPLVVADPRLPKEARVRSPSGLSLPSRVRFPPDAGEDAGGAMPSWGFLARVPPSPGRRRRFRRLPLMSFGDVRTGRTFACSTGSLRTGGTARLSRDRRPSEVSDLVAFLTRSRPRPDLGSWLHRGDDPASPRSRAPTSVRAASST